MPIRRARIIHAILAALVAGCLATACAQAAAASTRAANRAAAVKAATALVTHTPVPAGARRRLSEPAGDGHLLAAPPDAPVGAAQIDRHALYAIAEPLRQVQRFYAAHRPAGARQLAAGSDSGAGVPSNRNVTWGWTTRVAGIVSRQTAIDMVALPGGVTGVRIDAQVIYRVPRPIGEQVPAGVTQVEISRAVPGRTPDLSRTVTKPAHVRAIVALIDRLPIVQPDFIACPVQLASIPVVTFSFRAGPGGQALASASEQANVTEPTSACDALTFATGSHTWPSLLGGATFLQRVDRLVGTRFATGTPVLAP
jgi:hypothetical protein